jgi:hypothetical protein
LDAAIVTRTAAEIRAHLVDTTDDVVALREAAAYQAPRMPAPRVRETAADAGTAAWFDPFGDEDGQ